ncbi:MAG: 3-hydroxybutyryl-CoA dehydrogenase [Acidimicrobiia bacterium]
MKIAKVGVVGSGIMGSGITQVCAQAGLEVVLRSRTRERAEATVSSIDKNLSRLVEKAKIDEATKDATLSRIRTTSDLKDLSDCDLVIETVVEDLATKKDLFNHLDDICKEECLLATNTSTLPVVEMAAQTSRADKVLGIHFFNPAPVMQLVEVVKAITTSEETVEIAREFVESLGKKPVVVKDQAGFIVNALLFPYLNNAVKLLESAVATRDDIDQAMMAGCGFPMGPFALLDLVGLDTSLSIIEALYEEFRDPNYAPAPLLKRLVAAGKLGRKSGEGFYEY